MWQANWTDPLSGGEQHSVIGIYAHPSPGELAPGITSRPIAKTYAAQIGHFASDYAAKSLLWLFKLPL